MFERKLDPSLDPSEAFKTIRIGSSASFRPIWQDLHCIMEAGDLHRGKQRLEE